MNSVSGYNHISSMAANVGILTPPDHINRWRGICDAEMEDQFRKLNREINSKQKHYNFEGKKDTPFLVKVLFGGGIIYATWKIIKRVCRR